jgi:serine/threonine protein kinase
MAPEYLEKGLITKQFDIFSLGVIIIEIITGLKDYPTDETETTSQQYIDLVRYLCFYFEGRDPFFIIYLLHGTGRVLNFPDVSCLI